MRRRHAWQLLVTLLLAPPVQAQDFNLRGFLDYRLVDSAESRSFVDGGLGKSRFGSDTSPLQFGGIGVHASYTPAAQWLALVDIQTQSTDEQTVDALEAYVRYRPVSTTPWRWSTRAGWFFPPLSLENDAIGWTTSRTLTPSAINSWIGEEVRVLGNEWRVERRRPGGAIGAVAAVYLGNDPTGELLAARGWSLSDLYYGPGSSVREPDNLDESPPYRYDPFVEIDHRLGWYAGLDWHDDARGRLSLLRYDNRADPATSTEFGADHEVYSWHTWFWALAGATQIGEVELLAQAMTGGTEIKPSPFFSTETEFSAGYLLAAWSRGDWQGAARIDVFTTQQLPETLSSPANEHGNALTLALNWRPLPWLRMSAEWLRADSSRTLRPELGDPERVVDTQLQLGARVLF